jgi:hypothetical protein
VSIFAPFRLLIALAMALLIATAIASSAAHAMLLGDAVAQSGLGTPLRVVIPIRSAPGESLDSGCFRIVPNAGNAAAPIVTARVSLERAAATPRLIVTTPNAISEPAVQFTLQAGCDGTTRRNYVLLLDPPAQGAAAERKYAQATTQSNAKPAARGPRQETPTPSAFAQRDADRVTPDETLVVRAPAPPEPKPAPEDAAESRSRGRLFGISAPAAFQQVAVATTSRGAAAARTGWSDAWTYVAASLAILGVIGLAALLMRQHHNVPQFPEWTRGGPDNGPRTVTGMSMSSATLSRTASRADATTIAAPQTPPRLRPIVRSSPAAQATTARNEPTQSQTDPSTLDTLLNTPEDADVLEERAIREAWAAARLHVERVGDKVASADDASPDAILQAIEDAERDLLFSPPAPAQAAMDHALDDDLLQPPRRPNKAAA